MTIVVTGGGSGGHITPLLAIATEIKQQSPDTRIVYIGQRGDRFAKIVAKHTAIDDTKYIFAGKFRRYHGEGVKQLLDIKTVLLNFRDIFLILLGIAQSFVILGLLRPKKVFIKGGFVGVPVGLSAAVWHIPYITHDSDAMSGLANRIIARWATLHAVALPKSNYAYPPEKTVIVGVPTSQEYVYVDTTQRSFYRHELGIADATQVVTITGGGLGAQNINTAVIAISEQLLRAYPGLYLLHFTGHHHEQQAIKKYNELPEDLRRRVIVKGFATDIYKYTGAANVAIVRAGATNMAEMAIQGIACVVVPNPVLTGGHQLKNAKAYTEKQAAVVVSEESLQDGKTLLVQIKKLLDDTELQKQLGLALHEFAYTDSAQRLATIVLADNPLTLVD